MASSNSKQNAFVPAGGGGWKKPGNSQPFIFSPKNSSLDSRKKQILRELAVLFGTVLEEDIIEAIATSCGWNFQLSLEALMEMSKNIDASTPKKVIDTKSNPQSKDMKLRQLPSAAPSLKAIKVAYEGYDDSSDDADVIIEDEEEVQIVQNVSSRFSLPDNNLPRLPQSQPPLKEPKRVPIKFIQSPEISVITESINRGIKILVLMRGVPGSGKSFLARKLISDSLMDTMPGQFIFSTDNFFCQTGRYVFSPQQLPEAHEWNRMRVTAAMHKGFSPIIVDNTNTQAWEMKPYVHPAVHYGYAIEVLEPNTPWCRKEAELCRRNTHGVSREHIRAMLERYEKTTVGELLGRFNCSYAYGNIPPQRCTNKPKLKSLKKTQAENCNRRKSASEPRENPRSPSGKSKPTRNGGLKITKEPVCNNQPLPLRVKKLPSPTFMSVTTLEQNLKAKALQDKIIKPAESIVERNVVRLINTKPHKKIMLNIASPVKKPEPLIPSSLVAEDTTSDGGLNNILQVVSPHDLLKMKIDLKSSLRTSGSGAKEVLSGNVGGSDELQLDIVQAMFKEDVLVRLREREMLRGANQQVSEEERLKIMEQEVDDMMDEMWEHFVQLNGTSMSSVGTSIQETKTLPEKSKEEGQSDVAESKIEVAKQDNDSVFINQFDSITLTDFKESVKKISKNVAAQVIEDLIKSVDSVHDSVPKQGKEATFVANDKTEPLSIVCVNDPIAHADSVAVVPSITEDVSLCAEYSLVSQESLGFTDLKTETSELKLEDITSNTSGEVKSGPCATMHHVDHVHVLVDYAPRDSTPSSELFKESTNNEVAIPPIDCLTPSMDLGDTLVFTESIVESKILEKEAVDKPAQKQSGLFSWLFSKKSPATQSSSVPAKLNLDEETAEIKQPIFHLYNTNENDSSDKPLDSVSRDIFSTEHCSSSPLDIFKAPAIKPLEIQFNRLALGDSPKAPTLDVLKPDDDLAFLVDAASLLLDAADFKDNEVSMQDHSSNETINKTPTTENPDKESEIEQSVSDQLVLFEEEERAIEILLANAMLKSDEKFNEVSSANLSPDDIGLANVTNHWAEVSFKDEISTKDLLPSLIQLSPRKRNKDRKDGETNTTHLDFSLLDQDIPTALTVITAHNRSINIGESRSVEGGRPLPNVFMLDKGSMTSPIEAEPGQNDFELLVNMFPKIPKEDLREVFEKCNREINWTVELLLESGYAFEPSEDLNVRFDNTEELQNTQHLLEELNTRDLSLIRGASNTNADKILNEIPKGLSPQRDSNSSFSLVSPDNFLFPSDVLTSSTSIQQPIPAVGTSSPSKKPSKKQSQLTLQLKKQMESNFTIGESFYSENTLRIKKIRHGEAASSMKPDLPEAEHSSSTSQESDWDVAEEEEGAVPLTLDSEFVRQLQRLFGEVPFQYPEGVPPVVHLPVALARQIHGYLIDSQQQQLEVQETYFQNMIKDEEFARRLQQEEMPAPDMREIIDMEMALELYKTSQRTETKQDMATRLSKQKLVELFPTINRDVLFDIFAAHAYSFSDTLEVIEASMKGGDEKVKTVMSPEALLEYEKQLIKRAKEESLKQSKVADDDTDGAACSVAGVKDTAMDDAKNYRDKALRLNQLRSECFQKAFQAKRNGQTAVASYYSQVGHLYKEQIETANSRAASALLAAHAQDRRSTTLDLHFLYVVEALQALDIFLDYHVACLAESGRKTEALFIITGCGNHSAGGKARIKPAVEKRLQQRKLKFVVINPGMLKVVATKNVPLSSGALMV